MAPKLAREMATNKPEPRIRRPRSAWPQHTAQHTATAYCHHTVKIKPEPRIRLVAVPATERNTEHVGLARDGQRGDVEDGVGVPALVVRPGHVVEGSVGRKIRREKKTLSFTPLRLFHGVSPLVTG